MSYITTVRVTKTVTIDKQKLCSTSVGLKIGEDLLHSSRCEDRLKSVFKWEIVGIMAHYWNCGYTIGMVAILLKR